MKTQPCYSTKVYHDASTHSRILRLQALPPQTCIGPERRQHPCFPTSCHLQRRHHRQQTANRFKWSRCWEVAVVTMLGTHTIISSGRLATGFFGEVNLSFSASNNLDVAPAGGFT